MEQKEAPVPTAPIDAPKQTLVQPPTPPHAPQSNGLAITALIIGIVALLFAWTGILGFFIAVAAIVFGIVALVKKQSKGFSITGLVLGGVAIPISILASVIGFAILGGAFNAIEKGASEIQMKQEATDNAKKEFGVGETAVVGDLEMRVTKFTTNWQAADGFSKPKDGYEYAFVTVDVKNTSDETVSINPFDFKINDNGIVSDHTIVSTPTPLNAVDLNPGARISGDMVYEVKSGATGLKLEYLQRNEPFLRDATYSIELQ